MTLHDRIDADTTEAMRTRDRARLDALRLLRAALTNRAVADGAPPTARLDDATVLAVLGAEVKRRREAAVAFRAADREESAAKEDAEAEVYAAYLPAQLDDTELRDVVAATVARLGATGPRDAGPVIRDVLAATAGRADGGRVAALVRDVLAGS